MCPLCVKYDCHLIGVEAGLDYLVTDGLNLTKEQLIEQLEQMKDETSNFLSKLPKEVWEGKSVKKLAKMDTKEEDGKSCIGCTFKDN